MITGYKELTTEVIASAPRCVAAANVMFAVTSKKPIEIGKSQPLPRGRSPQASRLEPAARTINTTAPSVVPFKTAAGQ